MRIYVNEVTRRSNAHKEGGGRTPLTMIHDCGNVQILVCIDATDDAGYVLLVCH